MQYANALGLHRSCQQVDPSHISARSAVTCHETEFHRIGGDEHDWYGRSRGLDRQSCGVASSRGNDLHWPANKLRGKRGQAIILTVRPPEIDRQVLAVNEAVLIKPALERCRQVRR